ncbi:probable F-box protein At2g36090 [Neltuma alba]|uniref:probable F-box protein At2g36090 n=1 Tax=Neltuma alba TaxID=207710 RepID=UPI0010A41D0B|nr:probable F-box protein At2g36090 [Prosopis alba]
MACSSGTTIAAVPDDIIRTHILTRLHGPALASVATTSSQFYALSTDERLWASVCRSTWPSTSSPLVSRIISAFPHASRSFFSDSSTTSRCTPQHVHPHPDRTPRLISAVDLYYGQQLLLSKVVETETVSGWFRCSPFRLDLLDPKDVVQTPVQYAKDENAYGELRLSWIVIDPEGRRAMNFSSQKPVSVKRHWLSGEIQVRFASVLAGEKGSASELALCRLVVMCGGTEGGEMQVREVSMEMEDTEGMHMNGRESLVMLQRAMEGKRGRKNVGEEAEEEARKRYKEFMGKKKERREKKMRAEGRLDMICVALVTVSFATVCSMFVLW